MLLTRQHRKSNLHHTWYLAIACLCAASMFFVVNQLNAADFATVEVADPYIELHTGPGRGYPIFHVATRDESVVILKRKTDWFKVRTGSGKEGWVYLAQMDNTFTAPEVKAQFGHLTFKSYEDRIGEFGVMTGTFEGATLMSMYNGYTLSKNLTLDISVSQASGKFTQSFITGFGVQATPFPKWSVSPFFTLGLGYLLNRPRKNFAFVNERKDNLAYAGIGLRYYITRRLMLIGMTKLNIVFLDRNDNGEFLEWKGGVSIFY